MFVLQEKGFDCGVDFDMIVRFSECELNTCKLFRGLSGGIGDGARVRNGVVLVSI